MSTGIRYQDTARGIRKELSFHKVFLKAAKALALIGRMVSFALKEDRIQRPAWGKTALRSLEAAVLTKNRISEQSLPWIPTKSS